MIDQQQLLRDARAGVPYERSAVGRYVNGLVAEYRAARGKPAGGRKVTRYIGWSDGPTSRVGFWADVWALVARGRTVREARDEIAARRGGRQP